MAKIEEIKAREILDSRGNPTVSVKIEVDGSIAESFVPSGASTGVHEAVELRDGGTRFKGKGVMKAVENVNIEIKNKILNQDFDQSSLDKFLIELDGTENKGRLGANAILGVSMAFARASAMSQGKELYQYLKEISGNPELKLPQPMFNIVNGGKHADSGLDIQEFMLAPVEFESFAEKLRVGSEVFHTLKDILHKKGDAISVGDEGGFAPKLSSNEEALDLIVEAIRQAGYDTSKVKIGLDAAASSFFDKTYNLKINGEQKNLNSDELIQWYETLVNKYPLMLIEDSHAEDDWAGFQKMSEVLGNKIKLVGDDLLVTNIKRIEEAIEKNAVNSVLIKLNQIGTVTETIDAINLTKKQGWIPFVSHRSGETEDTFIADLSVGLSCDLIKSGSLSRGERIAKYNRLMQIEDNIFVLP